MEYTSVSQKPNEEIYFLSEKTYEYNSLEYIEKLYEQIENDDIMSEILKEINKNESIKMIIYKCDELMFLYKYTARNMLKQGCLWVKIYGSKKPLIEKNSNDIIILNKEQPDIIFDIESKLALLINLNSAEEILNMGNLFEKSAKDFKRLNSELNLLSESGIDNFIEKLMKSKKHQRKIHKIKTKETYKCFKENIEEVKKIIKDPAFGLKVALDDNDRIIFNEDTNIEHVLNILNDAFIMKLISGQKDIL